MAYLDIMALPLDPGRREDYQRMTVLFGAFVKEQGALAYTEALAQDVPRGETTDWYRAVAANGEETVAVAVTRWPDKATRDAAWSAMETDERFKDMRPEDMPFDGRRMFWGGFEPIYETS